MDDIHDLHHYGKYSFLDILEMSQKEINYLRNKMEKQLKAEEAYISKLARGK